MYKTSSGNTLKLGKELGKGGAATVYFHASDLSKAVKIFKPQVLQKEINLSKRIEKLNEISKIADIEIPFGNTIKTIGAWPKDIVKDVYGNVVGYIMDTVNGGIDLSFIVMARDPKTAFYKYRNHQNYSSWQKYFLYHNQGLKNRFILAYYLSLYFDKMYQLKAKNGAKIELDICNFDIKPQNILASIEKINGQNHIVPYILDLDNLTLKNSTHKLSPSSTQITPEYRAPEGPIDKYYDYWSLAVLFYQLIFNQHPFDAVTGGSRFSDGTERDFFIKNKCFPWGRNRKFLSVGTQNDFRHGNFLKVSSEIQQLFIRAFDSDLPSQRPSMTEWSAVFLKFLQNSTIQFDKLFRYQ
jgi:serine/threonine protein kinase